MPADVYAQVVLEQVSRPEERRCPIAKASNEIVEILSEHWAIFAPGCAFVLSSFHFRNSTDCTQTRPQQHSNLSS
jgi:hypothetical protein